MGGKRRWRCRSLVRIERWVLRYISSGMNRKKQMRREKEGRKDLHETHGAGWWRERDGERGGTYVCLCIHNMHTLGLIYSRSFLLFHPPFPSFRFRPVFSFLIQGGEGIKMKGLLLICYFLSIHQSIFFSLFFFFFFVPLKFTASAFEFFKTNLKKINFNWMILMLLLIWSLFL